MSDRKPRGTAAARRTNRRQPGRPGGDSAGKSPHNPRRRDGKQSTGDSNLSEDIAQEHQAQLNQLRDEPVPSSHYDERRLQGEQRDDGQE
jgi:hypothetical protein